MLTYQYIERDDDELYQFMRAQKEYYSLEGATITRDYVKEDMIGPAGFHHHYFLKVYQDSHMVGYVDYLKGYRYSMQHDEHYVWIGLFLVDEHVQHQSIGTQILKFLIEQIKDCSYLQLGCISINDKGMNFWKKQGFYEIGKSSFKTHDLIVFEKEI